jgi:3'-5' exoribonuclease
MQNESLKLIDRHVNYLNDASIKSLVDDFLVDGKYVGFYFWSGSSKSHQHHYGDGGLLRHTAEVIELCQKSAEFSFLHKKEVEMNVLLLSALFHDVGKLWDYTKNESGEWVGTEHKRNIHHISRSAIEWNLIASRHNIPQDLIDKVTHCILSHHGQREWGSPVAPRSREAWILHLCDGLSARIDDCDKFDRIK